MPEKPTTGRVRDGEVVREKKKKKHPTVLVEEKRREGMGINKK